jgi:hypothetical protein
MQPNTLRPGLLVSLKTALRGNVTYRKRDVVAEHTVDASRVAVWETERTIADAAEHEAAVKVRGDAAYLVTRVCANTAFGLLCTEQRETELAEAMAAARAKVDAFNATARVTQISINMIVGRVAADDLEAIRAINAECSELIAAMAQGVAALDASKVRDAAKRAVEVSTMLTTGARVRVEGAIEDARKAARAIAAAARAGETAAATIDAGTLDRLQAARVAFLDLDGGATVRPIEAAPANALDLVPEHEDAAPVDVSYASRSIDLGD